MLQEYRARQEELAWLRSKTCPKVGLSVTMPSEADMNAERLTSQGEIDPKTGNGIHVEYRKVVRPFMETSCGAVKARTLLTENNAR
jgi:hypothetical protein